MERQEWLEPKWEGEPPSTDTVVTLGWGGVGAGRSESREKSKALILHREVRSKVTC